MPGAATGSIGTAGAVVLMLTSGSWGVPVVTRAIDDCVDFADTLAEVPYVVLELSAQDTFVSVLDGTARVGCSLRFETTEPLLAGRALPDLAAAPGSALSTKGWAFDPSIGADGPGSSLHALTRMDVRCIVSWSQPSYIDDDGTLVVSEAITVIVQCEAEAQSLMGVGAGTSRDRRSLVAFLPPLRSPGPGAEGKPRTTSPEDGSGTCRH